MQLIGDGYLLDLRSSCWWRSEDGRILYWDSLGEASSVPMACLRSGRLGDIDSNWVALMIDERELSLSADLVRSHALFYAVVPQGDGQQWVVTDSPDAMRGHLPTWELNVAAAKTFGSVGFTLNEDTLIEGVNVVEAASTVKLPIGQGTAQTSFWGVPLYREGSSLTSEKFAQQYSRALDQVFTDLVERCGSRQLVVPLSGGLDSRLLVAWLKRTGASNILAFTYGKPGSAEAEVARAVARSVGIRLELVDLHAKDVHSAWSSEQADAFRAATWNATALPHVQDWYALTVLRERGQIEDEAVFLPGHTPVGMMHHRELLEVADGPGMGTRLVNALIEHHGVEPDSRGALRDDPEFHRAVRRAFQQVPPRARRVQNVVEWFNYRERQAKYINNSMAAYEHFGWNWALPLFWPDALRAWLSGPEEFTADRVWYREFVDAAFAAATGQEASVYFGPPAESSRIPFREALVSAARKTGANKLLSRLWELRVEADHPLALEAFSSAGSALGVVASLVGGKKLMGTWARDFLDNKWGSPFQNLVPPIGRGGDRDKKSLTDKPRLLLISYSDIAKDARLLKQIDLFAEDYDVTVLGQGQRFETPAELVLFDNADTRWSDRLRAALLHLGQYRLAHHFEANNVQARKLLRGREFDAVIANDIEPVGLALEAFGPDRVHADLHEYYPGLQDEDPAWVKLRQPYYRWMVSHHPARAASATTVSTTIAQRYRDEFGFECGVVENARPDAHLAPTPVHDPIRLVHAGASLPNRSIEQMMRAAAHASVNVTIDLFLTGSGTQYYRRLCRLAEELGPRVTIREPVSPDSLVSTLNQFDVGVHILPPRPTNNYLALPNKFFDFVQARLGIIVGPTPEMEARVRRYDIGEVTTDFSEDALVAAIDHLDADQVRSWKFNANRAAMELDVSKLLTNWAAAVGRIMVGK